MKKPIPEFNISLTDTLNSFEDAFDDILDFQDYGLEYIKKKLTTKELDDDDNLLCYFNVQGAGLLKSFMKPEHYGLFLEKCIKYYVKLEYYEKAAEAKNILELLNKNN